MSCILSIGNFDGVHLGHRELLRGMVSLAKSLQLPSVVITYTDHPAFVLNKRPRPLLLTPSSRKAQLLKELGVDLVRLIPFTQEFARTSAADFLKGFLIPEYHPHTIVVGYDSHFGHAREGTLAFLKQHASIYGYRCRYQKPFMDDGSVVSSSRIRASIKEGRLEEANRMLGTPYKLYGKVVGGQGLGRGLGFPTANLGLDDPHQLVPRAGVYLSRTLLSGQAFFGLTNIGTSPTLKHTDETVVETYMLDYDKEIYGAALELELLSYLRPEETFDSVEALKLAMHSDLSRARAMIGGMPE
jgi:riboflavin kinase/FMN adenylyltransferase